MGTETAITKKAALAAIKTFPKERRPAALCALIGHSRIQTAFWGYFSCGRCEAQIGDNLAGAYDASLVVVVGHDCKTCRENAKTLTWRDTLLACDPFPQEVRDA